MHRWLGVVFCGLLALAACGDSETSTPSDGGTGGQGGEGGMGGAFPTTGTCADPTVISVGDTMVMGNTAGQPNEHDALCALSQTETTGPELVFSFTPDFDGAVEVTVDGTASAFDAAVTIRHQCDNASAPPCCSPSTETGCASDAALEACVCERDDYCCTDRWDASCAGLASRCTDACPELVCSDDQFADRPEVGGLLVESGTTYFIHVDGFLGAAGAFVLSLAEVGPETVCDDLSDDDYDGRIDCNDTADCVCTPGAGVPGAACTTNSDCASTVGNDPVCLSEALTTQVGGYCSEWCDLSADDCPAGSICAPIVSGNSGACFETCTMSSDCDRFVTDGYTCQDRGLAELVCFSPPP